MAEMEMRMNPFEDVYAEFFMEKAIRLGSGSFGKVYLIQVNLFKHVTYNKTYYNHYNLSWFY